MGQAWNIWMHPRRAAARMQELTELSEQLSGQLDEANASIRQQEERRAQVSADLETAREQRQKSDDSVMELTRQLLKVRKALDDTSPVIREKERVIREQADTIAGLQDEIAVKNEELQEAEELETAMERFEQALSRAEEMKAGYEARITRLRARIVELNARLADPTPAEPRPSSVLPKRASANPPGAILFGDPDADWLQPLP